jgi:hypothetical protein
MGLFDIPAPLFTAINDLLNFLPLLGRLAFWAVITSIVSMVLYLLCSAQDKVEAAKQRAIAGRTAMAAYTGTEFGEMWPLAKESLAASGKHFLVVLGPAVLSSLPALTLIVWVSNNFGYSLPAPAAAITLQSSPTDALGNLDKAPDGSYTVIWPAVASPITVTGTDQAALFDLPLQQPVPVIHQKLWWNMLIGNPNGYLPADTQVVDVSFGLPKNGYLNFGPGWIRSWEFSYFLLVIILSLAIKVAFKIH